MSDIFSIISSSFIVGGIISTIIGWILIHMFGLDLPLLFFTINCSMSASIAIVLLAIIR